MRIQAFSKKIFFFSILVMLFFILWRPEPALACSLKISPAALTVKTGETVTFRLERYQTHKQCVLPLENTIIKVTGGKLTDPGTWKKGTPDVLIFKATFSEPGQAIVRVERNCPKEGLLFAEAKVNVVQGETTNSNEQTANKKEPQTPEQEKPATIQGKIPSPQPEKAEGSYPADSLSSPSPSPEKAATPAGITQSGPVEQKNTLENMYTKNLLIWSFFFIAGTLLYLAKKKPVRKPLIFLSLFVTGFYLGGCPEPMGAVYFLLAQKETMLGISLFLLVVPAVITLVWGRVFCGWMCPVGAVQEFIHLEGTGMKPVVQLPARTDMMLKPTKIIMLVSIGYLTWHSGINIWGHYEPFKVLFNFQGIPLTLSLLGIILSFSFFTECIRYLRCLDGCRYGALRFAPVLINRKFIG